MKKPFGVRDAKSFYAAIKANPLYENLDDAEVIHILEEEFSFRYQGAKDRGMTGLKLGELLFWQGAILGCQLMAKIFKHHIAATASDQSVDVLTGKRIVPDAH
jgi:hypothetical protein